MKNMSVLCLHEFRRECVMAFDLLTFCDKNRMLRLDIGELDDCEDVACEVLRGMMGEKSKVY